MKICAISDLHGYLPKDLPESDLLLIAGDIMPLRFQSNMARSKEWLEKEFKQWCKEQETYEIVLIGGNHDFYFEKETINTRVIFNDLWPMVSLFTQ